MIKVVVLLKLWPTLAPQAPRVLRHHPTSAPKTLQNC